MLAGLVPALAAPFKGSQRKWIISNGQRCLDSPVSSRVSAAVKEWEHVAIALLLPVVRSALAHECRRWWAYSHCRNCTSGMVEQVVQQHRQDMAKTIDRCSTTDCSKQHHSRQQLQRQLQDSQRITSWLLCRGCQTTSAGLCWTCWLLDVRSLVCSVHHTGMWCNAVVSHLMCSTVKLV